jgi:hypothetical protein
VHRKDAGESKGVNMAMQEIIEEIMANICDTRCKHPEIYTAEEWEQISDEICGNCPLNRLENLWDS